MTVWSGNDAFFPPGTPEPPTTVTGGGTGTAVAADDNLPLYITALLPSSRPSWAEAPGSGATIAYSFMERYPSYLSTTDSAGFQPMNEAQRTAARAAVQAWAEVANISFSEVADDGSGGILRFGTNRQSGSAGYAYYPSSHPAGGDVLIANNYVYNQVPVSGDYGPMVLVHEMGHALGLKHPGNYNSSGGGTGGPYLPRDVDYHNYTVMSYYDVPQHDVFPASPMLYDIAAIQYLYGANMQTRTGDDTYTFLPDQSIVTTIWDAGGTDTIDASAFTYPAIIQLWEGRFSTLGLNARHQPMTNNVAIAFDTIIENATGGISDDYIVGNREANQLIGGGGADSLLGLGGEDILEGGDGNDVLRGGPGADQLRGGAGDDLYLIESSDDIINEQAGEGRDRVASEASFSLPEYVEILRLNGSGALEGTGNDQANLISGNSGANGLNGGGGNDTLEGMSGNDSLSGGEGDDVLKGGAGVDFLVGGEGSDTLAGAGGHDEMTGGPGADLFVFRANYGRDLIVDFQPDEGDHIRITGDMHYQAQNTDGGVFLLFGGTARLKLLGVTAEQVSENWFETI